MVQSVGRAERYAGLQAIRAAPGVEVIVSDLLGFVDEGNSWSEELESARGKHATIWRAILIEHRRTKLKQPTFQWTPAHLTLEQALER